MQKNYKENHLKPYAVKSINSNSVLGEGDIFVVEADEYNRSLLELNPTIAVINNIDLLLECSDLFLYCMYIKFLVIHL